MQQIIDFILELDKLKSVERKTRNLNNQRFENSAEHSWQIAMLAWSLQPYAAEPVDIQRVVQLLLVHDLGEIDAGDVMVYADIDWAAQKQKEQAGVARLLALLPAQQAEQLMACWQEFETGETAEARFANACDRAMPVLLNLANHGQSWRDHGTSVAQVMGRIRAPIELGSPALWQYLEQRLLTAAETGWFGMAK